MDVSPLALQRRFYAEEIEATANLLKRLRRDAHDPTAECWRHGDGFCLSSSPLR